MDSAMARANQAKEEYKVLNAALHNNLWKSFPSSHLYYYIKAPSGLLNGSMVYLYADSPGKFRSSGNQPIPCAGHFKFTKNPDGSGSFAIYSMSKEKYLQIDASALISQVTFSASDCDINTKFVLTLYQQNLQPGLLVDIRSVADDDIYLYQEGNEMNTGIGVINDPVMK